MEISLSLNFTLNGISLSFPSLSHFLFHFPSPSHFTVSGWVTVRSIQTLSSDPLSSGVLWMEKRIKTNLQNEGLISADRGTKATLMRTIPRSIFKSYTKDLSLPIFELVFSLVCAYFCVDISAVAMLWSWTPESLYVLMITSGKAAYRRFPAWILA